MSDASNEEEGMATFVRTVEIMREKFPDGVHAPVIRSGVPVEPSADVVDRLREDSSCFGHPKAESDWIVHSGLRDSLLFDDAERLEHSLTRAREALDDNSAVFHPVDEKGKRLDGSEVELVTALVMLQRAWAVTQAAYRRGAAPLFTSSAAFLIDAKPAHLDPSRRVTLEDPRKSPKSQRTMVTVGDWNTALSGYAHRLMTRERTPTPRQLERELVKEGFEAFDLAKTAAYIIDGGIGDLAYLLEDDEDKKPTANPLRYFKIIWSGHSPGPDTGFG